MEKRIRELDYLKCIFIVLMVIFHLVYFSEKYPYAKRIVYTFHMPAFLILSGYLMNITKNAGSFFKKMLWIFLPYAFMEVCYVIMSSILPVREAVPEVTLQLLLNKTFLSPLGPYWYLHTWVICSIVYYLVYNYIRLDNISRFILLGISYFFLAQVCGVILFSNAMYFMIGVFIWQYKQNFIAFFQPCFLAIIPLIILCCIPASLDKSTLGGVTITWLVMSLLLYIHPYIPLAIKKILYLIGSNTLIILLFSPIFTILAKKAVPFFAFDPTGLLFMITAVIFVLTGCFIIAYIIDLFHLSKFCFGKNKILQLDNLK